MLNDHNPAKLLLAARDIMTGVMLPWHLGHDHKSMIDGMRKKIDDAIATNISNDQVKSLLYECIDIAKTITADCVNARNSYEKMDRARLSLECLQAMHMHQHSDQSAN